MADIALAPFTSGIIRTIPGTTTDALAKYGSVVISAGTSDSSACVTTTTAGDNKVMGIVQDQGDPNNSGLVPSGATVSLAYEGVAEVLVLGGVTYAVGDVIITSTTAGVAKKLASETTADQIGSCAQAITTGTNPQLISVRLNIVKRAA